MTFLKRDTTYVRTYVRMSRDVDLPRANALGNNTKQPRHLN